MTERVLVTCHQMQVALPEQQERLESAGFEIVAPPLPGQQFSEEELIELLPGCIAIIAGDDPLTRKVLASTSDLKFLIRWGIGMDSVDHDAARDLGIVVRNTPGVFGGEVADMAMAYVLMLARQTHVVSNQVHDGQWLKYEGVSLEGQILGLAGLGSIGSAVAKRANGFGMNVIAFDPYASDDAFALHNVKKSSWDQVCEQSMFVVLTCPLTPETFHLVNQQSIEKMNSNAYLINVGRGPLVDELALVEALERNSIAGIALDVFETEPLPKESGLRKFSNSVFGAHNGSNTAQGVSRASAKAVDILLELMEAR
jgi:D-3-phosphoglycerate dehydrogenase / 2-oxoglutarate reductase